MFPTLHSFKTEFADTLSLEGFRCWLQRVAIVLQPLGVWGKTVEDNDAAIKAALQHLFLLMNSSEGRTTVDGANARTYVLGTV